MMVRSILVFCIALSACSKPNDPQLQRLVVTGSSTVAPLVIEIGKRFEQKHPNTRIDVQTGGSSRGIADVRRGLSDIGMVSRALKDKEGDLSAFSVARDGVGIILHEDNPVSRLSQDQIIDIYTGKIRNWSSVGGANAPITVVNKAEGRSTLEVFLDYFGLKNSAIKADVIIGDNEQGIKTVAGNTFAIAYVSIGTAEHDLALGIPIKLVNFNGINASTKTIASGLYPLSRVLNLVTKSAPHGLSKLFIDFSTSAEVEDLIKEQSFVATST